MFNPSMAAASSDVVVSAGSAFYFFFTAGCTDYKQFNLM